MCKHHEKRCHNNGGKKRKTQKQKKYPRNKGQRQIKTLTSRSLPRRKGNFSIFFLLIFIEL